MTDNTEQKDIAGLMFVRKIGEMTILTSVVKSESVPNLKSEHQHVITGKDNKDFISLHVDSKNSIDIKEFAKGLSVDGLLGSFIWRTN